METENVLPSGVEQVAPVTQAVKTRSKVKQPVEAPRFFLGIQVPRQETLVKYGLTEADWMAILTRQGGHCGACHKVPTSKRMNIDHEHIRGWAKMKTADRKPFVRGLLCYMCNHYRLARGATVENLIGAGQYLNAYNARKLGRG